MLQYSLRRILPALFTLLIVSLFTFWLGQCAPRDPKLEFVEQSNKGGNYRQQIAGIIDEARKQGLYKPAFYFSFSAAAYPDTLYRVLPLSRRNRLIQLSSRTGNWEAFARFETEVWKTFDVVAALPDTLPQKRELNGILSNLAGLSRFDTLQNLFSRLEKAEQVMPAESRPSTALRAGVHTILNDRRPAALWTPAFHWYGADNRYHDWLSGFLTGNLGETNSMHKPVWQEVRPALWASFTITLIAVLIAYMAAVPLGIYMGRYRFGFGERWARRLLMFLYAVPMFIIGSFLTTLFVSNSAVFPLIDRFYIPPLQGTGQYAVVWLLENMPVTLLPILTVALHALAILTLQMRGGIIETMGENFIRTARAKGADEDTVYWRHAYMNALFPLIAAFPGLFPALFASSVVVEKLFNYYGIGSKIMDAVNSSDYPLIFILVMLVAVVIILSNLIADLLYTWIDPRVRLSKR